MVASIHRRRRLAISVSARPGVDGRRCDKCAHGSMQAVLYPYRMRGAMGDKKKTAESDRALAQRHLRELITALDRRVPHVERAGEVEIARAAAALRKKAVQRLA